VRQLSRSQDKFGTGLNISVLFESLRSDRRKANEVHNGSDSVIRRCWLQRPLCLKADSALADKHRLPDNRSCHPAGDARCVAWKSKFLAVNNKT
jgi:hypothetical protein